MHLCRRRLDTRERRHARTTRTVRRGRVVLGQHRRGIEPGHAGATQRRTHVRSPEITQLASFALTGRAWGDHGNSILDGVVALGDHCVLERHCSWVVVICKEIHTRPSKKRNAVVGKAREHIGIVE